MAVLLFEPQVRDRRGCPYTSSCGFTLIELLVSASILVVLSAVSVGAFANYAHTQQYQRVVDSIRSTLSLVRSETLASYKDTVYGVYVGTSTIEFFAGATPSVGSSANTIIDLRDNNLTATSSFSNGEWYLSFERLTGEATATGTITIQNESGSASTTFTILSSGLVE